MRADKENDKAGLTAALGGPCASMLALLCLINASARAQNGETAAAQGPSAAPTTPSTADDLEIIVTARKREERLFDVPVSVSAVSADQLARSGANNVSQIAENLPELNIGGHTAGGDGASITIRGVGTDGTNAGIPQSVSISIDGVPVNRGRALYGSTFDLQQVEVLKGPQALYFGKNSPAGVISLESKNPADHFEATSSVSYEFNAGETIGAAAASIPLADGIGMRIATQLRNMDGYMHNDARPVETDMPAPFNLIPGTIYPRNGEREEAGRLTLTFDRGGPFKANFKLLLDHYQDDGETDTMELVYCGPGFPQNFNTLIFATHLSEPVPNCAANWHNSMGQLPTTVYDHMEHGGDNDGNPFTFLDTALPSLTMNIDLTDKLTLTSVTGDYYLSKISATNNDWTSLATVGGTEGEYFNQFSQELRLASSFDGPLNFMAGGYFERATTHWDGTIYIDDLPADPATGKYGACDDLGIENATTMSAFGQMSYKIIPTLELSGGARYTEERDTGHIGNTWSNPVVATAFPTVTIPAGNTSVNVSPEATLTWRPNHDFMAYGAYKTGFQSGGINLSQLVSASTTSATSSFREETAKGFEAGIKTEQWDGRASFQFTGYRYTYDGLQISAYVPQYQTYIVSNAAASRSWGFELESQFRPTDNLTFTVDPAFNKSRYLSFDNASCYASQTAAQGCTPEGQSLSGRPTLAAPDWVANATADYHTAINSNYVFGINASAFGSTKYYFVQTQSPHAEQGGYARFNASARISPTDEHWQVSIIGRNLTDRRIIVSGQDEPLAGSNGNPGAVLGVLERPREIELQLNYKY
jgi:iron complex outermembrane receptor protein